MLHHNWQQFVVFGVEMAHKARAAGLGCVAWLQSNWWQKAVGLPQPWPGQHRIRIHTADHSEE